MRITTLIENKPHPNRNGLKAEHGLSFYIEANGHIFLSDVGKSGTFADNAAQLGLDISKVEALAISHHHYDHGGGLGRFFNENGSATVYLRQATTEDFVVDTPPDPLRYIGLDQGLLKRNQERIEMISGNEEVAPGMHLLTAIPDQYPKPNGDMRLQVLREDGSLQPDEFKHEIVTVIEGSKGLVLLTGCAHYGVLNMLAAVRKVFPDLPVQAVVGGFHLHHESPESIRAVSKKLREGGYPAIISGHCTGKKAMACLERDLGSRFQKLYTGMVMRF